MNEYLKRALDAMKEIPALVEEKEEDAVDFAFRYAATYAAIAQAEAAERQAAAMEKIASLFELVTSKLTNGDTVVNTYDCSRPL